MKVLFDTSVLVAAMVESHPGHRRALPWLQEAKSGRVTFLVAAHTLAELYAVLTRLPTAPRISPTAAQRLVDENVASHAQIVALDAEDYQALLQRWGNLELSGGAVYDSLIARAAEKAEADRLLTLNPTHFQRVWPERASAILTP